MKEKYKNNWAMKKKLRNVALDNFFLKLSNKIFEVRTYRAQK